MSTNMKTLKTKLILLLISVSSLVFSQNKIPDTLIVNSKAGKIILIADSIVKFKTTNVQAIINKAIDQISDSLSITDTLKKKTKLPKDSIYYKVLKTKQTFLLQLKGGGAFAAGRFTPEFGFGIDFAPQRQDFYYKGQTQPAYTFINLSFSSFWFFEKPLNGPTEIFQNTFIESSLGNRINTSKATGFRLIDEISFGAGYLIKSEGDYFGPNTFKVFMTLVPKNSFIGFKPELYLTNNFKSAYFGLSFRLITPASRLFKP